MGVVDNGKLELVILGLWDVKDSRDQVLCNTWDISGMRRQWDSGTVWDVPDISFKVDVKQNIQIYPMK